MKIMITCLALLASLNAYSADYPEIELTDEQCEDWELSEYVSLTQSNKKIVEDSCRERYTSENALGNCTAFEGEDLIKHLKSLAAAQCSKGED